MRRRWGSAGEILGNTVGYWEDGERLEKDFGVRMGRCWREKWVKIEGY